MNRTQELAELILYHNEKYFNDEPEISDVEYDALVEELKKIDPTNSALLEVGASPSFGKQVTHDRVMGSLIKVTFVRDEQGEIVGDGLDDLRKWEKEHPEKTKWGYKIDGCAGKLGYKNAKLLQSATRGDGKKGTDVTDNVRAIRSIPTKIESEILESYAGKPVKDIDLELLDPTGVAVEKWILQGTFLADVNFDSLGYSDDALATITATLRPDRCILVY